MHKLLLASSNNGKRLEFNKLLAAQFNILNPVEKLNVEESASTFQENALLKAKAYYERFKVPVLSDDSGLIVESHPEILGVHSARFAPEEKEYQGKIEKLLDLMENTEDRRAYFVCYLCFYFDHNEIFFFEGRLNGEIGTVARGSAGFGYDPVFYPISSKGQSLAELENWKQEHSHRAKACHDALKFFGGHLRG